MTSRKTPREVKIARTDYQPSKAELEADARMQVTFDDAVDALTKPVRIRYVDRRKQANDSSRRLRFRGPKSNREIGSAHSSGDIGGSSIGIRP